MVSCLETGLVFSRLSGLMVIDLRWVSAGWMLAFARSEPRFPKVRWYFEPSTCFTEFWRLMMNSLSSSRSSTCTCKDFLTVRIGKVEDPVSGLVNFESARSVVLVWRSWIDLSASVSLLDWRSIKEICSFSLLWNADLKCEKDWISLLWCFSNLRQSKLHLGSITNLVYLFLQFFFFLDQTPIFFDVLFVVLIENEKDIRIFIQHFFVAGGFLFQSFF